MIVTIYYTSYFKRAIHNLAKKYPHLPNDIKTVLQQLQDGEVLGDLIQHIGYSVYKVRIKNSDINKGKSAGYRMIYYVKQQERIVLLTIYSKSKQNDISVKEIIAIIELYNSVNSDSDN